MILSNWLEMVREKEGRYSGCLLFVQLHGVTIAEIGNN